MDVYNVSDQYAQLMESQKRTLLEAKKRRGQRPRDRKSREDAYGKFMLSLMLRGAKKERYTMHSSFVPPAYPPCVVPVAELRRVTIQDLQLETHHRGTHLILRSITPPSCMTAIMALVEDENGDVIMLQLYQQEDEDFRAAADIVNVGTVLLVKEPYFKVMGDGEYGLRVDHLSDVIHLNEDDARIPNAWRPRLINVEHSAESLKIDGNQDMNEGRYWEAIIKYSDALGQPATTKEIEIIKRNRALAFLKTKQFDAALADTGFPNFNPNPPEKALFRAAEALYHLERFTECCEVLELLLNAGGEEPKFNPTAREREHFQQLLCANFPENSQSLVVLARAKSRSLEQKTGVYDFEQLQAKGKKLRPPHLDHATYIGPVEIRQTESKGRGLFVTEAVKAGDLLLCEKAFCHAYAHEGEGSSKISMLINPETKQGFMGAQADLIRTIVQKLYRNPSVAPAFTTLHHGAYKAVSTATVDDQPIVDTFLVDRIISFNVFGCPVSTLATHAESRRGTPPSANEKSGQEAHHSCGIWTQASYINHSCTSNARRAFIGDMMIVRASRDLEPGTEITFPYRNPDGGSVKDRQAKLKNWGFVCECAICLDAKSSKAAVVAKRLQLMKEPKIVFNSPALRRVEIEKMERLLDALDSTFTRPADDVPRLLLWDPQLALSRIYQAENNAIKSLEWVGKALTSFGFVLVGADSSRTRFSVSKWGLVFDHLVEAFLHVRAAFLALGGREDSKQAEEYAKTAYRIVVGEDTSFSLTYG